MQCKNCERDKTAKLTDGKQVCTYCPEWLLECEAKELLRLPKSLAFHKMDEGEFHQVAQAMCRYIAETYWPTMTTT
jgi:hypothetical protein